LYFLIIFVSVFVFRYNFGEEGCLCNFEIMGGNPVANHPNAALHFNETLG